MEMHAKSFLFILLLRLFCIKIIVISLGDFMDDLKLIKKYYGEKFAHLCRELFPTILENNGLLFSLIDSHFEHNKFLYEDLISEEFVMDFIDYINNLLDKDKEVVVTEKSAKELLDEAGYILYECKTEEDIQKFRKYYDINEELCTFRGGRLKTDYVFFAVKKDIDKIKRAEIPSRQDIYGTSIISIQFSKKNHYISIKNRYNHSVKNPDATFSNNLDNIIPGLTSAFEQDYDLFLSESRMRFDLPGYVYASGKYYKYNFEIDNIYYCPNNIIIDHGKIIDDFKDKARYIFIDYFIIDIKKDKYGKTLYLKINSNIVEISIDKKGNIIFFRDDYIKKIDNLFMHYNLKLKSIILSNVKLIKDCFLLYNTDLENIYAPKLENVMGCFLSQNKKLKNLYLPSLIGTGNYFLYSNKILNFFEAPNLLFVGDHFLTSNECLEYLCLETLVSAPEYFLSNNKILETLIAPELYTISQTAFFYNNSFKYIEVPLEAEINTKFYKHPKKEEILEKLKDNGVWDEDNYSKIFEKL